MRCVKPGDKVLMKKEPVMCVCSTCMEYSGEIVTVYEHPDKKTFLVEDPNKSQIIELFVDNIEEL